MRTVLELLLALMVAGQAWAAYPAGIKAYYRGNSDGQVKNAIDGGPDMTVTGTVPNPSTPTPYEGDRWLAYGTGGFDNISNYMQHPLANALGITESEGCWVATINPGNDTAGQMVNLSSAPFFSMYLSAGRVAALDYTAKEGGLYNMVSTVAMNANANNTLRLEWDADGIRIYVNGSLGASTTRHAYIIQTGNGADGRWGNVGCCGYRIFTGYIDAIMWSSSAKESYPPSTSGGRTPAPSKTPYPMCRRRRSS
jgi:hypothetical protein